MNPRIFYIIYALYCFFLHLLIYCYYNYTKPPLPIIKELKTMQKQSFQRFPIRYRPYDFPSRFPVLAFLGDNWTISVNSPEYLHFHNGLEIGHCISGNGQLFLAGQAPVPYEAEAFSILFPQVPHIAVRGLQESRWEYIYIDPKHFLESASDCGCLLYTSRCV